MTSTSTSRPSAGGILGHLMALLGLATLYVLFCNADRLSRVDAPLSHSSMKGHSSAEGSSMLQKTQLRGKAVAGVSENLGQNMIAPQGNNTDIVLNQEFGQDATAPKSTDLVLTEKLGQNETASKDNGTGSLTDSILAPTPDAGHWQREYERQQEKLAGTGSIFAPAPKEGGRWHIGDNYYISTDWRDWRVLCSYLGSLVLLIVLGVLYKNSRVMSVEQKTPEFTSGFERGIFDFTDCFGTDCGLCFFSFFCMHMRWADTLSQDKVKFMSFWTAFFIFLTCEILNWITLAISATVFLFIAVHYRQKLRRDFGLEADSCPTYAADCVAWIFCAPCAIAQEARQVEYYKTRAGDQQ